MGYLKYSGFVLLFVLFGVYLPIRCLRYELWLRREVGSDNTEYTDEERKKLGKEIERNLRILKVYVACIVLAITLVIIWATA